MSPAPKVSDHTPLTDCRRCNSACCNYGEFSSHPGCNAAIEIVNSRPPLPAVAQEHAPGDSCDSTFLVDVVDGDTWVLRRLGTIGTWQKVKVLNN